MIKGRETKGVQSVCFPTRAHLSLMPPTPAVCSPGRPSEPTKSRHTRKKSMSRLGNGGGQAAASPLVWAKNNQFNGAELSEPTSPKVTCAGQIKVRQKASATCKSLQSVMEEIERIHNDGRTKKSPTSWMDSVGFKKDVLNFLTCLRNIKLDFRCFGAFPQTDVTSDDNEEDEAEFEEEEDAHQGRVKAGGESDQGSKTAFSKWFMVLQEKKNVKERSCLVGDDHEVESPAVPPPNALFLMRCRSAPAKSWLEEKLEEEERHQRQDQEELMEVINGNCKNKKKEVIKKRKTLKNLMVEEERNDKKESLLVMRYDTGLYKISTDIVKETWVAGGITDPFSRSRSWK